jgi:hypothetical protein
MFAFMVPVGTTDFLRGHEDSTATMGTTPMPETHDIIDGA